MIIFPTLRYRDANAAVDWLERGFGLEQKAVYRGDDGTVHHAELRLGSGFVMLGQQRDDGWSNGIYVVVADPDALHDRAVAAGARIVRALEDTDYGSREFSADDPEGNRWSFGTYDPCVT
jgi:uncharacterized glyoxalase superfamily protein PhnB